MLENNYRPADYILLMDPYVVLRTDSDSVHGWQQWERQRWTMDGDVLAKWINALGLDFDKYVYESRFKNGKPNVTEKVDMPKSYPIQIERIPAMESCGNTNDDYNVGWNIVCLEARVIAANLLDIRFKTKFGEDYIETFEVTHCGQFNVWWSQQA